MADKDDKKKSPSQKSTGKKKSFETMGKSHPANSSGKTKPLPIYSNPKFLAPAKSTERDMIKVLLKNPHEVFVFWRGNSEHFETLRKELGATSSEEVHFKLKIQYLNLIGSRQEVWYNLKPFTESYYCKFTFPVREIEANLFAVCSGKLKLFLETKSGDLPPDTESLKLDENWIHPKWMETGWVRRNKEGHFYFTDRFDPEEGETSFGAALGTSSGSSFLQRGEE